ncbi:developmental pluripotency associated 2 [Xenopus tropicalis]|uniref:Developmental pluripotency associated 2 n=1 Tax=Xenopus tropicalis TaxID=8364 RepID=B1H2Y1_XENTR|nr:developmental pluripotency associated 2 [Xenopus tropicalis]AAI61173.1 LOC100145506 protein [Xenopus tropicalis]|eukprot:NP_001120422.1 developmental pluripotency associated 2/4 [Xenopus tropicalis]
MPKRQGKNPAPPQPDLTPSSLQLLKRAQLQQHCKRLGLRGTGKNAELVQRLLEYFQQAAANQEDPQTPSPEKDESVSGELTGGRGWCVVHGQELTVSRWKPLFLRCGRVCMTFEGSCIPLHLTPSSTPTPCGLQDNLICEECFERNQERECRLQQRSAFQDKNYPPSGQMRKSTISASRSRKKSGRFQPQEDPEYARRVDELLGQLATGQVDSQKVLKPSRPAVMHSPLAKPESSPIAIDQ